MKNLLLPIRYYDVETQSPLLDFTDAPKGKLIYFYNQDGVNIALIIDEQGVVKTTHASFCKIIGDDTERQIASLKEKVMRLGEQYIGRIHLDQFKKDITNLTL